MRDMKTWVVSEIYAVRKALFFQEEVEEDFDVDEIELNDDEDVTLNMQVDENGQVITYAQKYIQEFKEQQLTLQQQFSVGEKAREESKTNENPLNS